jgi:L-iditol 2-dehydrogenase
VGAGIIGLLVVQTLRAAGWRQIIAVDIEPDKLELACQLGYDCRGHRKGGFVN